MLDAGKSLCSLLKMVFTAFPLDAANTPPDIKLLYQKVNELINKHVNAVTAPQASGDDNAFGSISFVLLVIKTLAKVHKNFVDSYVLVRILQRLARDLGSAVGSHPRQVFILTKLIFFAKRSIMLALLCMGTLKGNQNLLGVCHVSEYWNPQCIFPALRQ